MRFFVFPLSGALIRDALGFPWQQRSAFFSLAAAPLLLSSLATSFVLFFVPSGGPEKLVGSALLFLVPLMAIKLFFYVTFSVAWLKLIRRNETATATSLLRWDRCTWGFFWRVCALWVGVPGLFLSVMLSLAKLVGSAPLIPLFLLGGMVVAFPVYVRFCLILPGAALGTPLSWRASWEVTKGRTMALVWVFLAPFLIVALWVFVALSLLLSPFLALAMHTGFSLTFLFIADLLSNLVRYFFVAVHMYLLLRFFFMFEKNL